MGIKVLFIYPNTYGMNMEEPIMSRTPSHNDSVPGPRGYAPAPFHAAAGEARLIGSDIGWVYDI